MSRRRKPTLDEIEAGNLDDQPGPWNGESEARIWPRRYPEPQAAQPVLGDLATCWCGEPSGHSWPGSAEGAPHPR